MSAEKGGPKYRSLAATSANHQGIIKETKDFVNERFGNGVSRTIVYRRAIGVYL